MSCWPARLRRSAGSEKRNCTCGRQSTPAIDSRRQFSFSPKFSATKESCRRLFRRSQRRSGDLEVKHLYGIDYLRGDILARLDRPDEAIAAYRREILNSPEHLQSYANLAVIYMIEEDPRAAKEVLRDMVQKNPHRGAQ